MNLNNFTIQASETVQSAQQLAFNAGNPNIENDHILQALLDQKTSPVDYLLKKNDVSIQLLNTKLKEALQKLPKSGDLSKNKPSRLVKSCRLVREPKKICSMTHFSSSVS